MRRTAIILAAAIAMTSCGTLKKINEKTEERDSTRVEVRYEKIFERDTVYIEIPKEVEKTVTKAKESHLENEYARSDASVDTLGLLHHSLETKPQKKPVPIQKEKERRDSIIYRDREVFKEKPIYIEKELSEWQKAQIHGFRILVIAAALFFIWKYRRNILAFIRKIL